MVVGVLGMRLSAAQRGIVLCPRSFSDPLDADFHTSGNFAYTAFSEVRQKVSKMAHMGDALVREQAYAVRCKRVRDGVSLLWRLAPPKKATGQGE
jgi:hypothetical protein